MKVLDLQCRLGHSFEGWFGSQADYDSQREQGLVACPVCSDCEITKMLSAPRLNLGHGAAPDHAKGQTGAQGGAHANAHGARHEAAGSGADPGRGEGPASGVSTHSADAAGTNRLPNLPHVPHVPDLPLQALQQMQAAMLNMVRHVMANTEDVGNQFAEEARKIHYGESEARHIRGQATRDETEALLDEGIDVMALPVPEHLKGPLQ